MRIENETDRAIEAGDDEYPALLHELGDAPPTLFVRGRIRSEDALAVAVVGSRRATAHGCETAEQLAFDLAGRGVTVVSGLARGIDTAAHVGALRAGGRTIAVLGSGLDVVYPPENRRLAQRVAANGALVSQFVAGTPPLPHHFPSRNRVLAGLALAVVVVEAAERSGALITAAAAAELGREVMAVPGRARAPESRGTNQLIRDGAGLVETWEDVLEALPDRWRQAVGDVRALRAAAAPDDPDLGGEDARDAGRLLGALGGGPVGVEDVIEQSGVPSGRAVALLTHLELLGRVRQLPGKRFVRAGEP
jgi:DNA processing protein